ncbi:hypothetical protein [Fibrobacter sp.]|uniref:hypothetical protein n=1 Tax=Fibrobacter sp. TaxID=35828 RepID=UPI00386BC0B1
MIRKLFLFSAILGLLAACDDGNTSDPGLTPEQQQRSDDLDAISSTLKNLKFCFYAENAGEQDCPVNDDLFYLQNWEGRHRDYTIPVSNITTDLYFSANFKAESSCDLSNMEFTLDGKSVVPTLAKDIYDRPFLAFKAPENFYTEEHKLHVQMDSTMCEDISVTFNFIPSDRKPNAIAGRPIFQTSREKCNDVFFEDMYASIYQLGSHAIYADTVRSQCFLDKNGDTLMLDVLFDTYGITSLSGPSRAQAYLKGDALTKFIGEDTSATLTCALVYQSWIEPGEPLSLDYNDKEVHFAKCAPHPVKNIIVDDSLRITTSTYNVRKVYGKVWNKGVVNRFAVNYEKLGLSYEPNDPDCDAYTVGCDLGSHPIYSVGPKYICENDCLSDYDSIQVVVQHMAFQGYSSFGEYMATIYLPRVSLPADSATFDSTFAAMTDATGDILPDYRLFGAKRVSGK